MIIVNELLVQAARRIQQRSNVCHDRLMDLGLAGRVFVVGGGSAGLGFATASVLVAEGARVVIVGRDEQRVNTAVTTLGVGSATGCAGDLAHAAVTAGAIETAVSCFGRLDGVLANTGGPPPLPQLTMSNGFRPGLAMLVKDLADEFGPPPNSVRVTGVLPGSFATARSVRSDTKEQQRDRFAAVPLRRIGDPLELGRVAAFLLSPAASYVTGTVIVVDGGACRAL